MKERDLKRLKRERKRRVRQHRVEYRDGQPTPEALAALDRLGVSPAFVGESMTCEICGRVETSSAVRESHWRAIEADGRRCYFCPSEFPPDGAGQDAFELAYRRAFLFVLARFDLKAREAIREHALDRPVNWRA